MLKKSRIFLVCGEGGGGGGGGGNKSNVQKQIWDWHAFHDLFHGQW